MNATATQQLNPIDVIEQIRRKVSVRTMLEEPFFKKLVNDTLTPAQLKTFFSQYYVIVTTSYRMLAAGVLSTPREDTFMTGHLVRFLYTEAGGEPTHLGYYLRWAEAFGVTKDELQKVTWNSESAAFENLLMGIFGSADELKKLAAQVALEDCAEVLVEGLHTGFKKYPMSARAFGYLAAHILIENDEEGHSRWAIDSLAKYPDLDEHLEEVETTYNAVYFALKNVFAGIYQAWRFVTSDS